MGRIIDTDTDKNAGLSVWVESLIQIHKNAGLYVVWVESLIQIYKNAGLSVSVESLIQILIRMQGCQCG